MRLVRAGCAPVLAISMSAGCAFTGMDSFEPWQAAQGEYLHQLPPEHRDSFRSDHHAIAYALATNCFVDAEPVTELDEAVQLACRTDTAGGSVLSELMTFDDFCDSVRADRKAGADIAEDHFCDD